ncbi:MAG TPA: NifB/NifX family molybdenum-iron cluster-binding protein [Desulfobacterales bacterium]|nr:NifB/NifX family molybdenum-iron cluster-binding protein [Desulfobacterales bacterium]
MKIAVPLFGDRISPHFGASSVILMVETRNGRICRETKINLGPSDPERIARHLALCGVNRIVCGGIQRIHKQWLTDRGIRVVENQKGPAEEFLKSMIAAETAHEGG